MGHNPTIEEVNEIIKSVDADNTGEIEFDEFKQLLGAAGGEDDDEGDDWAIKSSYGVAICIDGNINNCEIHGGQFRHSDHL